MKPTTNIQSLTTIATIRAYDELVLLLHSIYLFHPDIPIFIVAQQAVCKKLMHEKQIPTNITLIPDLEEYGQQNWRDLPIKQANAFLAYKTIAIKKALESYTNTLYIDGDVFLTAPLGFVDDTKDIGLSPEIYHSYIHGRYNGGWVFASNKAFPTWWSQKTASLNSINGLLADQFALGEATTVFSFFLFPQTHDFFAKEYLFLFPGSRKYLHRALHFKSGPNRTLAYRNQTILSIHMHCLLYTGPKQLYNWILFHLHKQLPTLFNEIKLRSNKTIAYQVSQQDSLFFFFSFCFSQTLLKVHQMTWLGYILSNKKAAPRKTMRRYWFKTLERSLRLFIWPYYLWCLKQEIVYLYHLLVYKKAMITRKAFLGYTIRFTFLLLLSPITKRIRRNRKI